MIPMNAVHPRKVYNLPLSFCPFPAEEPPGPLDLGLRCRPSSLAMCGGILEAPVILAYFMYEMYGSSLIIVSVSFVCLFVFVGWMVTFFLFVFRAAALSVCVSCDIVMFVIYFLSQKGRGKKYPYSQF